MDPRLSALAAASAAALALGGWVAHAGLGLGLADVPAPHKSHRRPVPRAGGLVLGPALALGLLVGVGSGAWPADLCAYAGPALGFLLLGLADDRFRLSARLKLLGQALLAALAVVLGLRFLGLPCGPFPALGFGPLTPALTALWIVAVVTVVNFLDGIDLITVATTAPALAVAAGAGAGPGGGVLAAAALGGVLGLAVWNVTPARLFPGDGSTHLLGFLVASTALAPAAGPSRPLPWALTSALVLPGVVDVAAGLVAKARRGVPLAAAHRDHPYQRLTRTGLSHGAVALRYGALVLLGALAATWGARWVGAGWAVALGALLLALNLALAARAPRAPASFFVGPPRT